MLAEVFFLTKRTIFMSNTFSLNHFICYFLKYSFKVVYKAFDEAVLKKKSINNQKITYLYMSNEYNIVDFCSYQ